MDLRETFLSSAKARELTGVAIGLIKAQVEDKATANIRIIENGENIKNIEFWQKL